MNIQASTVIARDLSLLLRGTIEVDDLKETKLKNENLMFNSIQGFEILWQEYPDSCPSPNDWIPFKEVWKPDAKMYEKLAKDN